MPKTHPYRVYLPDGSVIGLVATPAYVAAEYPDALRTERTDVKQPPQIIEDVSGE